MSDNKKYYYLKLKDNFFDREEIKMLEKQEGGYLYSNLYLKLCLMSLKGDGRLLFRDEIPYDENMISVITGLNLDNVRAGLIILERFGLIKRIESGEIYMADIHSMIGHGSSEAERKAAFRAKINSRYTERDNVRLMSVKRPPELELEKELELELEKKTEKKKKVAVAPVLPACLDYPSFQEKWAEWLTYRKELRKPLMPSTIERQWQFLSKYPNDAPEIIKKSMDCQYQGLFPLTAATTSKSHASRVAGSLADNLAAMKEQFESGMVVQ